ncbi:hypothetical protein AAEX37_00390 [Oligella sp. MSHR50489EDL]
MYPIQMELPNSKKRQTILPGMDEQQQELLKISEKHFGEPQ